MEEYFWKNCSFQPPLTGSSSCHLATSVSFLALRADLGALSSCFALSQKDGVLSAAIEQKAKEQNRRGAIPELGMQHIPCAGLYGHNSNVHRPLGPTLGSALHHAHQIGRQALIRPRISPCFRAESASTALAHVILVSRLRSTKISCSLTNTCYLVREGRKLR